MMDDRAIMKRDVMLVDDGAMVKTGKGIMVEADVLKKRIEEQMQVNEEEKPNRRARRAHGARQRAYIKKNKKMIDEVKQAIIKMGIDPSKIESATAEDIRAIKAGN